jgi:tetratricopeptide (TPR) repeat protein
MLSDEMARDPPDARPVVEMGGLLSLTNRPLQAIEQYRAAVRLDESNLAYREYLASALYEAGMADESLSECQAILDRSPANATALRLANVIRLSRGQDLLPQPGSAAPAGLAVAQALLANGRPQDCINLCLAQLNDRPTDVDARLLMSQAYLVLKQEDKCLEQLTAVLKQMPDRLPPEPGPADLWS